MKLGFSRVGWILVGLLAISAGLISLGESDSDANPAADSYAPSGTAALFQLLDRQGFNPVVERSMRPRLREGDVILAFVGPSKNSSKKEDPDSPDQTLRDLIWKGSRAVILPFNREYQPDSEVALQSETEIAGPNDAQVKVSTGPEIYGSTMGSIYVASDAAPLWQGTEDDFATTSRLGKGLSIVFSNGIFVTNRFIDRADNAQVIVSTLAGLRGNNGRVVFLESTFRNAQDTGFLARIGPWAQSAWWQILVVFGAVIYTENRRFGLPERLRSPQRGLRELFDAVADTQRRSRDSRGALASYLNDAEHRMRKSLKLPREMGPGERGRILPPDLHIALVHAQALLVDKDLSYAAVLPDLHLALAHAQARLVDKDLSPAAVLRCVEEIETALGAATTNSQSTSRL